MLKFSWKTLFLSQLLLLLLECFFVASSNDARTFQRVYQTEDSVRRTKAHSMSRQMNVAADPCIDFYEYACGKRETQRTPLAEVEQRIDGELLRLLEENAHHNDSAVARQAKNFYKSCLAAQTQRDQQHEFLSQFIEQNGGFPAVPGSNWPIYHGNYNWLQVVGQLRKQYGLDILIGLHVGYNFGNVLENSLYLGEPSTLIPRESCGKGKRRDRHDQSYVNVQRAVARQLKQLFALTQEQAERVAVDIVSFEYELCSEILAPEPWNAELQLYTANYTRTTLAELHNLYRLDFETYVRIVSSYGQTIYRPVFMAAADYYRQLRTTLDAHNDSQVANYIMYRAVSSFNFPLDKQPAQRPAYCLASVKSLLPSGVSQLYAGQYGSEEARQQLEQLFEKLKESLLQSVTAKWLEEHSRRVAQRKLSTLQMLLPTYEQPVAITKHLDHNKYWQNLRYLLEEAQAKEFNRLFEENLPRPADPIEAYETRICYRPVQRKLELGWALLQPPDYDDRYGQAVRFATLGSALGEEMSKAFDELHWSVGLLERDFWDGLTKERYQYRSKCFSSYIEDYLQANSSAAEQLISASAGLNVAFNAYLNWLGFQEPNNQFELLSKETLPEFNYSNTALFFIAYAQRHCQPREQLDVSSEPRTKLTLSVREYHSWTRLRVNGPLRNMPEFAREFHCPAGSPMNPADKCIIY